jgi:hypothetical protein
MASRFSLFEKRPTVSQENGRIIVRNSLITRLLNGYTHVRRVELDPVARLVRYSSRFFWFFNTRLEVPFQDLSHLTYIAGSMETGFSRAAEGLDTEEVDDEFSLAFVTTAEDFVEICTYSGGKPKPRRGQQDDNDSPAAELVLQLRNLLGVGLETGIVNRKRIFTRCPGCGRKISRHATSCIYCKKTGQ